jgi:D-psicose/D-tagatose/L-ribulose 3-epimerase
MKNKIGIYFAYWTKDWSADYLYYLNKVSHLGFDVLEVSSAYILELPKFKRDELKKAAQDKGMEITYCIGFPKDKDMASEDEVIRRNGIEYAKKTLEYIYFMEGKIFVGINYSSWPGILEDGITDKSPYLERSINSIKEVIKTAEDYGIFYCVEIVNRFEQFLLNTASEGVTFCEAVGSPNIKILLDVFHMNIEEDFIGEAILTAGDKLGHLHIGECNRKTPGKGHMPWDEIIDALRRTGYDGRIVMEPFVKMGGEVGRDIKVWRDLSGGADEAKLDADAKAALEFIRGKMQK